MIPSGKSSYLDDTNPRSSPTLLPPHHIAPPPFDRKPLASVAFSTKISKMSQLLKTNDMESLASSSRIVYGRSPYSQNNSLPHPINDMASTSTSCYSNNNNINGLSSNSDCPNNNNNNNINPNVNNNNNDNNTSTLIGSSKIRFWCPKPSRTAIFNKSAAHRHTPPPTHIFSQKMGSDLPKSGSLYDEDDEDQDDEDDDGYSESSLSSSLDSDYDDDDNYDNDNDHTNDNNYGCSDEDSDICDGISSRLASCSTYDEEDDCVFISD